MDRPRAPPPQLGGYPRPPGSCPRRASATFHHRPPSSASRYEAQLSDEGDAIQRYLGCEPTDAAARARYARASLPTALDTPTLLVTGSDDADVPPALVR